MSRGYQPDLGLLLAAETLPWQDSADHWLTLVPEEPCGQDRILAEPMADRSWPGPLVRGSWEVPWLRPVCSCGWKGGTIQGRFVISENAIWHWRKKHLAAVSSSSSDNTTEEEQQ